LLPQLQLLLLLRRAHSHPQHCQQTWQPHLLLLQQGSLQLLAPAAAPGSPRLLPRRCLHSAMPTRSSTMPPPQLLLPALTLVQMMAAAAASRAKQQPVKSR
jgi:hypothetical protein